MGASPAEIFMTFDIDPRRLRETLAAYQRPCHRRSAFELAITAGPFAILWIAALLTLGQGWCGARSSQSRPRPSWCGCS